MPESNREDGVHVKEVVARVNAAAAVGIAAALLGVGGYLLVGGDGVSPSGSTPSIESPEDAAPRSAADIDTRPPGVSLPAAEGRTARAAEDALDLARAERRRIQAGLMASGLKSGPADGVFGAGTRSAIREWQAGRGLPATGYLNAAEAEELLALGRGRGEGRRAAARPPRADVEDSGGRLTVRSEPARRIELDGAAEDQTAITPVPLPTSTAHATATPRATTAPGPSFSCSQGSSPNSLFRAVEKGDMQIAKTLADLCPEHVNTEHQQAFRLYETPLSLAVKAQAPEMVRFLLEAGADPDATTQNAFRLYDTPLSLAVKAQTTEMVRILVEAGADPNKSLQQAFRLYDTPLSLAVKAQTTEMVRILVEAGTDPNKSLQQAFRLYDTPLSLAVKAQATEMVRVLLEAGADPNKSLQQDFRLSLSPLDIAIEEGYTEIATILLGSFN